MSTVYIYPPTKTTISTAGLATEAKQDTIISGLSAIEADVEAGNALLTTIDADTSNLSSKIDLLENRVAGSLVPETFDYQEFTYVTVGNGIGEIETAVYKTGGSGGSTVATLTFTYDASDSIDTVTRS